MGESGVPVRIRSHELLGVLSGRNSRIRIKSNPEITLDRDYIPGDRRVYLSKYSGNPVSSIPVTIYYKKCH